MRVMRETVCAAVLLLPLTAGAFEGSLKLRTVSASRDQLAKVTGGSAAPSADQALAITPAQLVAAQDAGVLVRESMVYVSGSKVRMDLPLDHDKGGYAIVDTDKGTTWFVVPAEKRYIEWSEADAKAMGEKMTQVEKMMKERMASLPPEQRAQVEAMMKNIKPPSADAPAPKVNLKALDKTQTVNGMQASAFQVQTGDATLVGWVTQDQPDLAKTLHTVQERMEKMTPVNLRGRETARNALGEKGFPVMVQTLDPGHYRVEEVLSVQPGGVKAELFVPPSGFTKTTGRDALKGIPEK